MADIPLTGSGGPCQCCCGGAGYCTSDDDCSGIPGQTCNFGVAPYGGCCWNGDPCGGCSACEICQGSGEDVACAACPSLAHTTACIGFDTTTHPECSDVDFDGNGVVDFLDFAYYRTYCNGCG